MINAGCSPQREIGNAGAQRLQAVGKGGESTAAKSLRPNHQRCGTDQADPDPNSGPDPVTIKGQLQKPGRADEHSQDADAVQELRPDSALQRRSRLRACRRSRLRLRRRRRRTASRRERRSGWAARNPSTAASRDDTVAPRDATRADNSAICCRRSSSGSHSNDSRAFPGSERSRSPASCRTLPRCSLVTHSGTVLQRMA